MFTFVVRNLNTKFGSQTMFFTVDEFGSEVVLETVFLSVLNASWILFTLFDMI